MPDAGCNSPIGFGGLQGQTTPGGPPHAPDAHPQSRQRDGSPPGVGSGHWRAGVLLRSAQPLATGQLPKHQGRLAAPFMPKGADLRIHDQDALDSIADLMNNRPWEALGWKSPDQTLQQFTRTIAQHRDATTH